MLTLSAPLALALVPARSASDAISRNRSILFEIYSTNYFPDVNGLFDPEDAIERWAKHDCTWLGNIYEARILSHSGLSEYLSGQFNGVSLTVNNADRALQQFCDTNVVDGLRLVVRYVSWDHSAALADSRQWVLRLQAPDNSELDREQGDLTAKEELATLDCEIPKRRISPEDPEGRSPNDPLYEGFQFNARPSSVRVMSDPEYHTRWLIFRRKKETVKHAQWSSQGGAEDAVLPLYLGRAQREGLAAFWFDIGFYIIGVWVYSGHKITSITNFLLPDTSHIFYGPWAAEALKQAHVHLGDPGGTGTNATPDTIENNYPQNTALLSRTGYVGFAIGGPESETQPFANAQMDPVPTLVAVVLGEMDLPNGAGVFNQVGFSDSPVYAAREVLTSEDYFGLDPLLVNDSNLPAVHAERQRPIIDKSNGEFLALMEHDLSSLVAGDITRLSSTGLIDSRYFRHLLDPAQPDPLVTNRNDAFAVSVGGENPGGGDQLLTDGITLAGQSVTAPAWKYYYIDVPVGATQVQFIGTGAGDATLFTRQGSKPTTTTYDCTDGSASPQSCIHDNPTSGRWWIGVHGNSGVTTFTIIAIVTEGMTDNVLPAKSVVRKAWTLNLPLTDHTNAIDFLNNAVLATGRLYRVTDTAGRQDIRAKKASDSTYLISDAPDGQTFVLVANVEAWRASQQGYLLINPGLTTSEYRAITSAEYHPATGNAITLAVSGTGLTASGATLAGGTTALPSSGTVTVSSASGDLVVTVWGIPITYTVLANDINASVAGMLTTLINADPNLNQYVRAEWEEDAVVHIYSTVGKLIFASALVNDHDSQVDSPVVAPAASAVAAGTLDPGSYYLGYSLVDGSGSETLMSPLTKIVIASGQKVSVTSLGALPTGAAEVNWYFSPAPNDDHVQFLITNTGGTFTIDDVADYDADYPPTVNQTGAETIRVAEVFNQFNIRHGSFKWVPSASKINLTEGEYIDAANGFKRTPVRARDRAHQRAIKQINKKEINLSGVDNFSQATRLCHATLAEERDGGAGAKWTTDDAGIAFEIGDVVAVNDYRWDGSAIENYLVNQPIFITERTLAEDFDVSFAGKVYSSSLLEGQIGRKPVVIPTTLKYLTEAPPIASNVSIVLDETYLTGVIGDFDFGEWAGQQRAIIFIKGPSESEPSDDDYKILDTVIPDANRHGHFELRAAVGGNYWIKIVTQSQFGQSLASGHPVTEIEIRPRAISDAAVLIDAFGDYLIGFLGNARMIEQPATWSVDVYNSDFTVLQGTLPVTAGTTHACLMNAVHVSYDAPTGANPDEEIVPIPGGGSYRVMISTATDKNNLFSLPWDGVLVPGPESGSYVSGVTLEAIESTYQRFDFTCQWLGADGSGSAAVMTVAMQTRADANPVSDLFTPVLADSPLSVSWEAGTLSGTVKETIKSFGVTILVRDNVDPGFGSSTTADFDVLEYETYRRGQRYSFTVAGNEYRAYLNFGAQNQQLLAVISCGADGPAFPLRLAAETGSDLNGSMAVMNITRGGDQLSTIYSVANQVEFQGSQQSRIYLDIYQDAKALLPTGVHTHVIAPPL